MNEFNSSSPPTVLLWNSTSDDGYFAVPEDNNTNSSDCVKNDPPGFTGSGLVVAYCVMFVIAAAGNLSVIITLFRSKRHRRSRISLMICHLAVADLIVAFFMIPLEIGWRLTVEWKAGNVACKVFLFLRAFCLYLSSNVLVCVSLDRCFAVVYPLRVTDARRRGKSMLLIAWIIAGLNALPQSVFFRVQSHPQFPGFQQCVTFDSFSNNQTLESAYNLFCLIAMYFVPLLIISIAYGAIICEISNRSNRQHNDGDSVDNEVSNNGTVMLRCSALSQIQRARQRTFRLTITIVAGFIWCWTPYVVMASWYIIDKDSAARVNTNVQDGLFLMAVSNSCLNPLIYSTYSMRRCRFPWTRKRSREVREVGKTELQRRSTGTMSRTSVLSKLTNARTNVQNWNKNNVGNEPDVADTLRVNHRNKNLLLFNDNGNCRVNYKHHHSAKNLSNSQLNSLNTNSRTSRNMSGDGYGDSDDYEDNVSGRVPAANLSEGGRTSSIRNVNAQSTNKEVGGGKRNANSFYCISLGNITAEQSYFIARPSFYSDPTRQCDWDADPEPSFKSVE